MGKLGRGEGGICMAKSSGLLFEISTDPPLITGVLPPSSMIAVEIPWVAGLLRGDLLGWATGVFRGVSVRIWSPRQGFQYSSLVTALVCCTGLSGFEVLYAGLALQPRMGGELL